jgi:hypothetical protein
MQSPSSIHCFTSNGMFSRASLGAFFSFSFACGCIFVSITGPSVLRGPRNFRRLSGGSKVGRFVWRSPIFSPFEPTNSHLIRACKQYPDLVYTCQNLTSNSPVGECHHLAPFIGFMFYLDQIFYFVFVTRQSFRLIFIRNAQDLNDRYIYLLEAFPLNF